MNQRLIPNAMEPRACVAQWSKPTGEMTVWTTSQNPQPIRLLLSAFTLGIPENRLRVISPDVGGGFGSKIFHYPEEIITPWVVEGAEPSREVGGHALRVFDHGLSGPRPRHRGEAGAAKTTARSPGST